MLFLSSTLLRPSQTLLCPSVCHTFPKKLEFAKKKNGICQKKWNLYWILDFWRPPAGGRRPLPVNRNYSYYLGPTPHIVVWYPAGTVCVRRSKALQDLCIWCWKKDEKNEDCIFSPVRSLCFSLSASFLCPFVFLTFKESCST